MSILGVVALAKHQMLPEAKQIVKELKKKDFGSRGEHPGFHRRLGKSPNVYYEFCSLTLCKNYYRDRAIRELNIELIEGDGE